MVIVEAKVMDSTHLELLKPLAVRQGLIVLVSVTEAGEENAERRQWLAASSSSLKMAYGDSEPDYSVNMVRENNPNYSL